jgi:pyruvate dehydrogenase E2 component (dihydrolipoamide acetyltransferase)
MPTNITMPALSPTMESGTLAKWHVKEGDEVSAGDVIAEIETDKATMEVEAVDEGTIGKIMVKEGTEDVAVNAVIAVLLQEGESAGDFDDAPKGEAKAEKKSQEKAEAESPRPSRAGEGEATSPAGNGKADGSSRPSPGAGAPSSPQGGEVRAGPAPKTSGARVFASPLARRLAKEDGIDLSALTGSGPHGRVVKRDIEKAKIEGVPTKAAQSAGAGMPAGPGRAQVKALYEEGSYEVLPLDGMRRVVAQRMTESKQTVPHFYLTLDCRIDVLMAAREDINATAPKDKEGKPAYKLSVNDFILKAWAVALQNVPMANATWAGDAIFLHKHSDISVAVAVPGGLFTPVVRAAETKTLRQISEEVRDLATRARDKKLAPHEYQGGTSSLSNLGMYGIKEFDAVINPPQGTILAVGVGEERVYAENGEVKIGSFMSVTLSCDHRSVDGALGAELLGEFKRLIEQPVMMLA